MAIATERSLVAAVFDNRGKAEAAVDNLWHAGFRHDQIGILMPGGGVAEATTATEKTEENAAEGAVTGAATGGAIGALVGGLAAAFIPGVGPVLAGGILTGVVLGGAAGAAAGSYLGPFLALGFSEDQAHRYHRELKAGRTVVTVRAEDRAADAVAILRSHGGQTESTSAHGATGPLT
jgi:Heat induced stress protein YflT